MVVNLFFFNDTATTDIYTYLHTLSLPDALPISPNPHRVDMDRRQLSAVAQLPDDRLRDFLDRSVDEDEVERRMLLNAALKLALYNLRALPQQPARARSEIGIYFQHRHIQPHGRENRCRHAGIQIRRA